MKKSKIIAPAAAILVFSSAAAVTGTVAWFTASRVATISMQSITAINPVTGLDVIATANSNFGTSGGNTEKAQNSSITHSNLRDASVDVANAAVYKGILDSTGEAVSSFEAVSTTSYLYGTYNTKALYYATKFNASFSSADTAEDLLVVVDFKSSTASFEFTESDAITAKIKKALRIGIMGESSNFVVWAPFADTGANLTYVNGTALSNTATYADANKYIGSNAEEASLLTAASYVSTGIAPATNAAAYLGELSKNTPTDKVDTIIYTWFEGTDPNCVNGAEGIAETFVASLSFKAVKKTA